MSNNSLNQEWFDFPGTEDNYRTMVYYPGTGGDTFEFNFEGGYINRSDIKAFMVKDDTRDTEYLTLTFKGPNTVQTNKPVPKGWTICIFRDTPKGEPLAKYQDGAVITAANLDRNAQQAMFAVSEMVDRFDSTVSQVDMALKAVYEATQTADAALAEAKKATGIAQGAVTTANAATATANAATVTANAASQRAEQAAQTAIDAKNTANSLDAQIKSANATAQAANKTAGEAKQIAQGVDGKATKAQSDAAAAVKTANEAKQTAESIDAKATQAQKDAAEALKKAQEVEGSVGTVQELSSRVKSFGGDNSVVWKGPHTVNKWFGVTSDTSTDWGAIVASNGFTDFQHKSGNTTYNLRVGSAGITYAGNRVLTDGTDSPKFNTVIDVRRAGTARLNLINTANSDMASAHVGTNGNMRFESYTGGQTKNYVSLPNASGTLATEEWTNDRFGRTASNTVVMPPDKSKMSLVVDNNNSGFYRGNAWMFRVDQGGGVFALGNGVAVKNGNSGATSSKLEVTSPDGQQAIGLWAYNRGSGGTILSAYAGGAWSNVQVGGVGNGTLATREWVNANVNTASKKDVLYYTETAGGDLALMISNGLSRTPANHAFRYMRYVDRYKIEFYSRPF